MGYVEGEARGQYTLFPAALDELIAEDHVCRVMEAFVNRLDVWGLASFASDRCDGLPLYHRGQACPALRAMLAGQAGQEPLAFQAALLLDAQLLIPLEALRVELSVPVRGERPSTSAAMVLMSCRRFFTVHPITL